jgi:hypothetical protein
VSGHLHALAALPPGERIGGWEVGCTSEPIWTIWRRENSWPYRDSNSDLSVVQPVASRYPGSSNDVTFSLIYPCLYSPMSGPVIFFYTDRRTPWTWDEPVTRPLPRHSTTQIQNKCTHRHPCLWVWFEPTIPAFERAKIVHALDRAAIVIGRMTQHPYQISWKTASWFKSLKGGHTGNMAGCLILHFPSRN